MDDSRLLNPPNNRMYSIDEDVKEDPAEHISSGKSTLDYEREHRIIFDKRKKSSLVDSVNLPQTNNAGDNSRAFRIWAPSHQIVMQNRMEMMPKKHRQQMMDTTANNYEDANAAQTTMMSKEGQQRTSIT